MSAARHAPIPLGQTRIARSVDPPRVFRQIVAEEVLQGRPIQIARLPQGSEALLREGDFPAHLAPMADAARLGVDLLLEGREPSKQLRSPDLADAFTIHSPSS